MCLSQLSDTDKMQTKEIPGNIEDATKKQTHLSVRITDERVASVP